jgi:hypothetical protein
MQRVKEARRGFMTGLLVSVDLWVADARTGPLLRLPLARPSLAIAYNRGHEPAADRPFRLER